MSVLLDESLVQKAIGRLRVAAQNDSEAGNVADSLMLALKTPPRAELSPEEFAQALEELARYHDSVAPADRKPLSDYAVSRAGIYEEDETRI